MPRSIGQHVSYLGAGYPPHAYEIGLALIVMSLFLGLYYYMNLIWSDEQETPKL